jgi:hypothetical protein
MNSTVIVKAPLGSGVITRLREDAERQSCPCLEIELRQAERNDLVSLVQEAVDTSPHGILIVSDLDHFLAKGNGRPGDILDTFKDVVAREAVIGDFVSKPVVLPVYWTIFAVVRKIQEEHAWYRGLRSKLQFSEYGS